MSSVLYFNVIVKHFLEDSSDRVGVQLKIVAEDRSEYKFPVLIAGDFLQLTPPPLRGGGVN